MRLGALIIGHSGQDGSYLSEALASREYSVLGLSRTGIEAVNCDPHPLVDVGDKVGIDRLLAQLRPREVYYLAAYHHSAETETPDDHEVFERSLATHAHGLLNVLEGLRRHAPDARLFYAASSHLFGDPVEVPQSEETPFRPTSPYGISKLLGVQLAGFYRRQHGLHCACGILFNHESPRRPPQFLSRKIAAAAAAIHAGHKQELRLGNLDAQLDMGYAPDYVDAMWRILQLPEPGDFVISTGKLITVRDLLEAVFSCLGLDWHDHVVEDPSILIRQTNRRPYVGDNTKLRQLTGWAPSTDLAHLARHLVESEIGNERSH